MTPTKINPSTLCSCCVHTYICIVTPPCKRGGLDVSLADSVLSEGRFCRVVFGGGAVVLDQCARHSGRGRKMHSCLEVCCGGLLSVRGEVGRVLVLLVGGMKE